MEFTPEEIKYVQMIADENIQYAEQMNFWDRFKIFRSLQEKLKVRMGGAMVYKMYKLGLIK